MNEENDWVPRPIDKFIIFSDNFCKQVVTHGKDWGTDTDDSGLLITEQKTFKDNHAISSVPQQHTTLDTQKTNNSRKPFEERIRKVGMTMKTNTKMSDDERTACGVVNDSTMHSLSPVATVSPVVEYERAGNLAGEMLFSDPVAGKPDGQNGITVTFGFYVIGSTPPTEANCTQTIMFKKKHGIVVFDQSHFGMAFVAFARYFNTRLIVGSISTKFGGIVS